MGGSSKQTVGYKYFAGLQVVIGNCIEYMININPDNRGWIFTKPEEIDLLKTGDTSITVNKPNLFGGDKAEGGWVGIIDIHTGKPETLRQNEYLAEQDSQLISAYPYLSYLVFRGTNEPNLEIGWDLSNFGMQSGFQLVSMSGMLKDVLYWVKRIHVKDDGSPQWYDAKSEVPDGGGNDCYFQAGSYAHNGIYISNIGSTTPLNFISYFSNYGTSAGYIERGQQAFEYRFSHASSSNQSFKIRIQLNSAESLPTLTFSERIFLENVSVVKNNDSSSYWNYIVDYTFGIVKGSSNTNFVNFSYIYSGPYEGLDDRSDVYFAGPLGIDYTDGYICPIDSGDINPIHKIREVLTDYTAMNKPEAMINDANFMAAADRIWDEGLGVSGSFTEKSCKEAIDELLYHIEAGIRVNRQTGLYEIVLFRDDLLDLDNAQLFDKSNIKTFSIETANIDDVINSVNVNYYDRDYIKDSSFSLDELGSILSNQSNAETLDFPYFMNRRNAELVGNWKLKQLSTPTRKGSFTTGKYDARKINRYDVVKLTWHNQNMIEVPIRIMKIGLGDGRDNTVTLDWVEVIPYSSIVFPTINVDPPTSNVLPPQPNQSVAFEMPYFEAVQRFGQTQVDTELANNLDLGYLMVATKKPQNNSINALLYTDNGTGYQQTSIVDYCPVVQLDQDISYLDTSFAVKNVSSISQAEVGTLILCDEELMVYQNYDDVTKILTVKRAALDTVPKPHFQDAVFYFYDAFSAFDSEQYVLSEVIDAKVLTTTPSGVQELADATVLSVEMDARAIRPYPPANVKINNAYYPAELASNADMVLTWVDRNRVQQTGGDVLGYFDAGVTIETGVTYSAEVFEGTSQVYSQTNISANTVTVLSGIFTPGLSYTVRLKSVRDGIDSLNYFEHTLTAAGQFVPVNVFIGTYAVPNTNTAQNLVLTVPVGAQSGDYLCVVISCRADRSFTIPSGWTAVVNDVFGPSDIAETSKLKVYVLKKLFNSETSVTFTQSVSAACQGFIHVLRGDVVANYKVLNGSVLNFNKTDIKSSILKINIASIFGGDATAETISLQRLRTLNGYSNLTESFFHNGDSSALYFYYLNSSQLLTSLESQVSISTEAVQIASPQIGQWQGLIALEIAQP